jgi:hypothetical protein
MRLTKHLTVVLAVAAVAASGATANDKPAKPHNAARCRPAPVLFSGTLANDPVAGDTSFQLLVKRANRLGRLYAKAGNPVSLNVDAKTRLRRSGKKVALDALALKDRAIVLANACRADVRQAIKTHSALPELTARLVYAQPAKKG